MCAETHNTTGCQYVGRNALTCLQALRRMISEKQCKMNVPVKGTIPSGCRRRRCLHGPLGLVVTLMSLNLLSSTNYTVH